MVIDIKVQEQKFAEVNSHTKGDNNLHYLSRFFQTLPLDPPPAAICEDSCSRLSSASYAHIEYVMYYIHIWIDEGFRLHYLLLVGDIVWQV